MFTTKFTGTVFTVDKSKVEISQNWEKFMKLMPEKNHELWKNDQFQQTFRSKLKGKIL